MIRLSPTFLSEYHNASKGLPYGFDTNISISTITKTGKKIVINYADTRFLKNPVFPAELYEYRRGKNMKLSIDGEVVSLFAERNLAKNIYRNDDMKTKVSNLIDLCRQYMKNDLEQEMDDEIKFFESTEEADDERTLEYHYDLRETIKSFNDYLCIVFLNLANILIYPNETFYKKYVNDQFRIEANTALHMASKICKRMQDELTDIILENFQIRETSARTSRVEKESEDVFDTKEVIPKESGNTYSKKKPRAKPEKQEKE